ncbi:hypothetical protein [Acidocella sp.]|uniref:hypothetical protein n=1 Tax=Acidocella sp. TaxID=50710 RepID=UPI0017DC3967|nr:hypothetical protein [Acidocella sp.]NNM55737.1 hypothetical protein [Acidocella sp.]
MVTLDELRKHVLEDAVELIETLGIVEPLVTNGRELEPVPHLLRRLLTRHIILVSMRLHENDCSGKTGHTASIDSVLKFASQKAALSTAGISKFRKDQDKIKNSVEVEGFKFADLRSFRTAELAHSLHPHTPLSTGVGWHVIHQFASGTYNLVKEIEIALIAAGASHIQLLSADAYDHWATKGELFWRQQG